MDMQPCSVARLMSVIFGEPMEVTFPVAGLKLCPWCDKASMRAEYYPFCNKSCLSRFNHQKIPFECSECGTVKLIVKSVAMARMARTASGRMYCSKKCQGIWLGRVHGVATRPWCGGYKFKEWGEQCKNGHPWTPENVGGTGKSRYCKLCKSASVKHRKAGWVG